MVYINHILTNLLPLYHFNIIISMRAKLSDNSAVGYAAKMRHTLYQHLFRACFFRAPSIAHFYLLHKLSEACRICLFEGLSGRCFSRYKFVPRSYLLPTSSLPRPNIWAGTR